MDEKEETNIKHTLNRENLLLTDTAQITGFFKEIPNADFIKTPFSKILFSQVPMAGWEEYEDECSTREFNIREGIFSAKDCPCAYPASFLIALIKFCKEFDVEEMNFNFPKVLAPMHVELKDSSGNTLFYSIAPRVMDIHGKEIEKV